MISEKLWEQIQKEGKESGFGIAKIDFPSEEHNNQCVIYLKRTPEFYTMKEEREEERKRAEQKGISEGAPRLQSAPSGVRHLPGGIRCTRLNGI